MAVLEKIRQKKKILAIVIGGALLAFIVEVGVEALGRGAGSSTVAKVGGEKIDVMEFQNRVQEIASREQNNPQRQDVDQAVRQTQVLEEMIAEKLLDQECEEVGLTVTDGELTELMIGKNAHYMAQQLAASCGAESPAQLNDFINNPGKYNADESQVAQLKAMWQDCQDQVIEQYRTMKLAMLVDGGIQANDLDLAQIEEEQTSISYISYVKKELASLQDDKYPVKDEEIKAEWEKQKKVFAIDEECRGIHFIAVRINPSKEDLAAAAKVAQKAEEALKQGTGIEAVRALGTVKVDEGSRASIDQLPANLVEFVGDAQVGFTKRDSTGDANGRYLMYKLTEKKMAVEKVTADRFAVNAPKADQDKVLAMLNEGKSFEEIQKTYKKSGGALAQELPILNADDEIYAKIDGAEMGKYIVLDSNENEASYIKVTKKDEPKMFYKVATVTYDAYASAKTSEGMHDKLQAFLNKNKTAAEIYKNAPAAGYNVIPTTITGNTPQLEGIKDSRKAIKWAFENNKGDVSPIFTDNHDFLLVTAIDDVFDEYMPYTEESVKQYLTTIVRNNKKGEALMKQYDGKAKTLDEYAKLMGAKVDSAQVMFGNDMNPALMGERGLVGRIAAAKQGQVSKLYKGDTGVYVFKVDKVEKGGRKMDRAELVRAYNQTHKPSMNYMEGYMAAVLGKATKVERNLVKFY